MTIEGVKERERMGRTGREVGGGEKGEERRKNKRDGRRADERAERRGTLSYGSGQRTKRGQRGDRKYLVEEQGVFPWVGGRMESVQWLSPVVLLTNFL